MVEAPEDNPYVRDPDTSFAPVEEIEEETAREQVRDLRAAIEYHDYRYYVVNDPVVADRTYDALFDRLAELEEAFDLHDENSPTRRVGGEPLDELETVAHVAPLLSLQSAGDADEIRAFDRRIRETVGEVTYSAEPKFDGFSVEVVYEDSAFERAVTRGDGQEGEDVSANVRTIGSVPLHLDGAPDVLAVRGEVYMPRSGFVDLNERRMERGEEPFANPRNAAAGTVRLLDPSTVADRPLDVFFYDVIETSADLDSQREAFDLLRGLGFRVNDETTDVGDVEAVIDYRDRLMAERDDLEYEIDGVVAKVVDFAKRERLGSTARHPRWAFAYKFPPRTGETAVERIVVQVGRTGKLTPVALLDPVDLQGVTISRATLHNAAQVDDLGVHEGATVRIERAGDVIPEVVEVVADADADRAAGDFAMPDTCPVCDGDVVREGEHHYCTNASCPAQLRRSLQHFCSRDAMDIEGVGAAAADQLVEAGLVESLADLYTLDAADLAALDGWGERSAENLLAELEASKAVDLGTFVYALGIRHVGTERARALAAAFSLDELLDASVEALRDVEDVGPEVAASVASYFDTEANVETVERLLEAGVDPERRDRDDELDGLTVVFTGSVPGYTRSELTELLETHGANVTSSVSGATDYLVVGENPGQRKRERADEEGVETLGLAAFEERILSRL
ncbi:NAD-dependent DNA ligase LigA [Haloplanus pelagicus]|jgi:DNA ligase (NAD+)|uniref:NAD-dependent DNA ligase LigA n=1 Tax=Haloplanus pelagicus TaxID=2949995 RepID=UPI00203C5BBB|nr:NAD-dependent DNA ligase LigA [Haloplanus sp. HW8-1]